MTNKRSETDEPLNASPPTHRFLVGYSGELSLKGKGTRNRFSERLARNLADALRVEGIGNHHIERFWARTLVRADSAEARDVIARVFGVSSVAPVEEHPWSDLEDLLETGRRVFEPRVAGKTFAVRVRRGNEGRQLPFRSPEVERRLGALLAPGAAGVDLRTPEVWARIELRRDTAFFSSTQVPGTGGLPLGSQGRALSLVSGGFDSAVASWLMLRRGVRLDYVFFNLGGDQHRDGMLEVMKVVADRWSYGDRPTLHLVDFRPVADELRDLCPPRLWQVLLKRQMLRAAEGLVRRLRMPAMVTGEAVGQVSSQTLQNLAILSGTTPVLILRPLIATPKEEITDLARRIGTYEASSRVAEYCALAPKNAETHASIARVLDAEEKLDPSRLEQLLDERTALDLRTLDLERIRAPDLEVDGLPAGATRIDLRSKAAFESWHLAGAEHHDYRQAIAEPEGFDSDRSYVIYCEVGLKSAHLAEVLRAHGRVAHHLKGGLRTAMKLGEQGDPALAAALSPVLRD